MLDLLKIEYKKIIPYQTFWVIFGLVFILTPLVFYGFGQVQIEGLPFNFKTIYHFPNVWNNITYVASWFNLLIGVCVVILTCNEFAFRTFKQHIIDGQNRVDFIVSKILLMTSFALLNTFYLLVLGTLFGSFSDGPTNVPLFKDIHYLLIYFVQSLGYMSLGLIMALLIRTTALSIILFIFSIIIENILQIFIPYPFDQYLPLEIISNLTPVPFPDNFIVQQIKSSIIKQTVDLNITVCVAILYIFIFWGGAYLKLRKGDIR